MIVYNNTMNVSHEKHEEFITWCKNEMIPDLMSKGFFTECKLFRLLNIDETDGPTYSMQLYCNTMADFERFQNSINVEDRKKAEAMWGDHVYYYRTIMGSVQ